MNKYVAKDSLGYWLSRSARLANQHFDGYLKEFKFTTNEYVIMNCVQNSVAQKPSEIAEYLNMDRGYVTRHIEKLVKRGLLKRTVDKSDRRQVDITLTQKGKDIYPKLAKGSVNTNKQIEKALSVKELNDLRKILEKLGNANF